LLAIIFWLVGSVCAAFALLYLWIALLGDNSLADGAWLYVAIPAALALISFVWAARLSREPNGPRSG
jgi:predicted Na+-dependent transporter